MSIRTATAVAALVIAAAAIAPAQAQPWFDGHRGEARFRDGPRFREGFRGFDGPGYLGEHGGWRTPHYGAVVGLRGFVPPPAYFAPPPIYFAPPPIVVGLAPVAPRRAAAARPTATPAFDPGPLLGAAVAPPVVVLPQPALIAEAAPPPIIPTPLDCALPITPPVVADAAIPASWRVDGYITAAYARPAVARRVIRTVPLVRYEAPPPVLVFAEPPPYYGPPVYGRPWHRGWDGPWRHHGWHGDYRR